MTDRCQWSKRRGRRGGSGGGGGGSYGEDWTRRKERHPSPRRH